MNYFYDLPFELQLHVFSFIPKLRDVKSRQKQFCYKILNRLIISNNTRISTDFYHINW